MNKIKLFSTGTVLLVGVQLAKGQSSFDSGSDGSLGPLVVNQEMTIQLPPDGILNYTTINIESGRTLTFVPNAQNTPVYMLATGDVVISGRIDVDGKGNVGVRGGKGGPGGFAGGNGGPVPGDGNGPGAGGGGWFNTANPVSGAAGYGTLGVDPSSLVNGEVYGNSLLIPLTGGSGGGGGTSDDVSQYLGGGGGGGAILIASNTEIQMVGNDARVFARGGTSNGHGGGSGGAIRLVAPSVVGRGELHIEGSHGGGFGRGRIDAFNSLISLQGDSAQHVTFGANMVVFPPVPFIRITEAAGQAIAPDRTDPVFVLLPTGTPSTQTVQVSVTDFNASVPLVAVVTPEAGERQEFDFSINNSSGGTSTGSVQVEIPAGVTSRVDVWTR